MVIAALASLAAPLALGGCGPLRREALRRDLREATAVDDVLTRVMRHITAGAVDSIVPLLAPEFVLVEAGRRFTREEYLEGLRQQRATDVAARFTNRRARVAGDAAYLSYDLQSTHMSNGVRTSADEQGTLVLLKMRDHWAIVLWQISDVPAGAR